MREPKEIAFRLRQEAANLWLLVRRPAVTVEVAAPLEGLPDPARISAVLRGSVFATELARLADAILAHRFPLLGSELETGPRIAWRRDYQREIETGTGYFRLIPYLNYTKAGDHKFIWELNRHQHLVLLAQSFRTTDREEYLRELFRQLEDWWKENPFQRGINWASALEVGFRALSWIWIYHLAGEWMPPAFRARFLTELYRHGCHLEQNLSIYFSPNTHLLGEAVALHALGTLFPRFPGAERWKRKGARIVSEQTDRQVREDGSHFEQSSYYHLYALDMFLFHFLLASPRPGYRHKLEQMAEYLAALIEPAGTLPFLGDDDGGRLFHPYGLREGFARATLATCAVVLGKTWGQTWEKSSLFEQALWWMGPEVLGWKPAPGPPGCPSRWFAGAGLAAMRSDDVQAIADAGPFGAGSGGHSHSDTLSLVVRRGRQEILIDPGTYTYVAEPEWRDWFRGSAAHNTVRVDGRDQAAPAGPFRWVHPPKVEMLEWVSTAGEDYLDAACEYLGIRHRRRILFVKPHLFLILDELEGPPGEHRIEQFWHLGQPAAHAGPCSFRIGASATLTVWPATAMDLCGGGEYGWRSPAFGVKRAAPALRIVRQGRLPATLAAALWLQEETAPLELELLDNESRAKLTGGIALELRIPARGKPAPTSKP